MARRPSFLVLLLLGTLPGPAAAFRRLGGDTDSEDGSVPSTVRVGGMSALFDLSKEKDVCDSIDQCYCIKGTQCGWCKSTGKAMLGTASGPLEEGKTCSKWIAAAADCPVLYCRGTDAEELGWWVHCGWLPFVCLVLWIYAVVHKRQMESKDMPTEEENALMRSVNFASGAASFEDNVSQQVAEQGPTWAEQQSADFFSTRRTFESFRKGMHCPAEERLPTKVSRPYELNLSDLSCRPGENYEKSRVGPHRVSVTVSIALQWRTALGATMVNATGLMLVSALFIMFLRNAARSMNKDSYAWVALATKEVGAVTVPLQTAVGMLLSFYALNRISWFWSILMQGHALQGRCHDLGMISGSDRVDTEENWRSRYLLYRHLMLTFFFSYQPYTPRLRFSGFGPLLTCGLMEPEEADILSAAHRGPGTVVEGWLANWIELNLEAEARQQAYHSLRELRGCIAVMQALVDQRAPVSFESLLFCVVYALVAILPLSLSNVNYTNREAVMDGPHIATVFGTGIICAFYLALIHMLRHLQAPFDHIGAPNDALNPLALMNSTERKLRDYLTLPTAKELRKKKQSASSSSSK